MKDSKSAVFFLSTGRCGTQWLTSALSQTYRDVAIVTHEPVRGLYKTQTNFRNYHETDDPLLSDKVMEHITSIEEILTQQLYIETGWPCYSAIPWIINKLNGRVKLVHLVRHPVDVALSLTTHKVYSRDGWISSDAITPFDKGVLQGYLAKDWARLTMYEKCVFLWTELNLYAIELKEVYGTIPYHFVRSENMFREDSDDLRNLVEFMGLPYRAEIENYKREKVDSHRMKTAMIDWELINKYPKAIELSKQFGYTFNDIQETQLKERYIYNKMDWIKLFVKKLSYTYRRILRSF